MLREKITKGEIRPGRLYRLTFGQLNESSTDCSSMVITPYDEENIEKYSKNLYSKRSYDLWRKIGTQKRKVYTPENKFNVLCSDIQKKS